MKEYRILFSVGKDRPGIVDDITTVFHDKINLDLNFRI
jgi:predicted amino acid-binding ACT domain protein